jgi:hypothetical protein
VVRHIRLRAKPEVSTEDADNLSEVGPPPPLPVELLIHDVRDDEEMVAFRIVTTDDVDSPEFVDCFRSHAELGIPPRKGSAEISHPAIYEGISMQDRQDRAIALAQKWPKLGDFVAEVRLDKVAGATYYVWERPRGHLTVWGDPFKLSLAAVDIVSTKGGHFSSGLHDSGLSRERSGVVRQRGDGASDPSRDRPG